MRNIIVFGHDPRMESVAGYFYHLGYDVYENPEEPVADACVITAPKLSEAEEEIPCAVSCAFSVTSVSSCRYG